MNKSYGVFVIECPKTLLDKLRGYMSDGGGEYSLSEALSVDIEDIRTKKGEYVGIRILGESKDDENE